MSGHFNREGLERGKERQAIKKIKKIILRRFSLRFLFFASRHGASILVVFLAHTFFSIFTQSQFLFVKKYLNTNEL